MYKRKHTSTYAQTNTQILLMNIYTKEVMNTVQVETFLLSNNEVKFESVKDIKRINGADKISFFSVLNQNKIEEMCPHHFSRLCLD